MLHPVIRWLARRAIRLFYRDAELLNAAAVPATGAVLIVASHGNDLPDILMTFLVTRRDILFVANIAAAASPLVRLTYAGLGVIPVSRVRDARRLKAQGKDAGAVNAHAFVRVVDALRRGHAVAIFPEGIVHDFPHLGPLRNGAARMALEALDQGVPLAMVAVGYQYERPWMPRSGALSVVGSPVAASDWRAANGTGSAAEFTGLVRGQLEGVTRNARTEPDAARLAQITAATGAALSSSGTSPIAAGHRVQLRLSHLTGQGFYEAGAVALADSAHSAAVERLETAALAFSAQCIRFGARDWSARDHADVLFGAGDASVSHGVPSALRTALGAPVAALGWAWHAFPWWLSYALAVRYAPRPAEVASRAMVPGLYVMVVWYVAWPLLLLVFGVISWPMLLLFLMQPQLGDFAMGWRDRWRTLRLVRRVRRASPEVRDAVVMAADVLRGEWRESQKAVRS